MSNTKIKAAQFYGVVGNGTNGYFLMANGDGSMTWVSNIINPTITNVDYPGTATAADPAGGETITLTGTNFKTGATVTIGGTSAPSVSYVSATELTITTPAKTAGDYDVVVTNTDGGSATFVNGISYNGIPAWTTAAGSLGTFASEETISTITLQASEPDAGTITFNITNGALPTGLSLTGANIDGTTSLETADTLYTFTVTATDDENQATPRTFTITVTKQFISSENFTINTYTGNGSTQSIEGKIGTAARFNSSYIDIPVAASSFQSKSVSFWFRYDPSQQTNSSGYCGIWQEATTVNSPFNGLQIWSSYGNNGTLTVRTKGGTETTIVTPTANQWYHLCVTYDRVNGAKIYLDGSLNTTISDTTDLSGIQYSRMGANFNASSQYYIGDLDQFRLFNKALSSSEVSTLAAESNSSTTKSTTDIFDDGSGVVLYEFEEGAKDTGGVNGYIGAGGVFNGSSSKIDVPTITANSVSFWVYLNNFSSTHAIFGHSSDTSKYLYIMTGGEISTDGVTNAITPSTSIQSGTWEHIAFTESGGTTTMYLNGQSVGSASVSIGGYNQIGARTSGTAQYLDGKLDQVRFFDKALSSSEVTTLYGETSASSTKSTTDIFDDGSGVALYELEGNANTAPYYPYGTGAIDTGQSAVFNGSDSYIDSGSGILGSTNYTVSLWFYANSLYTDAQGQNLLYNQYSSGLSGRHIVTIYESNVRIFIGGNTLSTITVPAWETNKWYHVAVVKNSSGFTVYINNTPYTLSTTANITTGANFRIGKGDAAISENSLDGSIDQVRVYSSALSASDVEALVSETNVPTANLVAHYKLDGNANDETGSYNGTASNVTYSDAAEFPLIAYNGTATNVSYGYDGTPTNVSFVGTSFQPDLVWFKQRNGTGNHALYDSVRGVGNYILSNSTSAEGYVNNSLTSFDSNGFTLGSNTGENASGINTVAWAWKAGGAAVSNTDGSITSTVSANPDSGFSIVKINNGSSNTFTFGTGLNQSPELIITKSITSASGWTTWYSGLSTNQYLYLNTTDQVQTYGSDLWNLSAWDGLGLIGATSSNFNNNLDTIAYCFHSVDGYQKVGSYTGTNATNAVTTGFEPRFLMVKLTSAIDGQWVMYDNVRSGNNPRTKKLAANASIVENDSSSLGGDSVHQVNFTSTGFELLETSGGVNTNKLNETYIYLAIA